MEDNKTVKEKHGTYNNSTQADEPATSKFHSSDPERVSHNMDDLKVLDFNSADEVRQRMKQLLSSSNTQENIEEYPVGDKKKNSLNGFKSSKYNVKKTHDGGTNEHEKKDFSDQNDQNIEKNYQNVRQQSGDRRQQSGDCKAGPSNSSKQPKKRGRKPKAGPSKRSKICSVKDMYKGKLTNLVFLSKRRRRRRSDTDCDSSGSI